MLDFPEGYIQYSIVRIQGFLGKSLDPAKKFYFVMIGKSIVIKNYIKKKARR